MRKITLAMYVTLDGVVEEPMWTAPYFNDELGNLQSDLLFASDALLLGRKTYELFAESWPGRTDEGDGFTDRMNSLPKYVASTTLTDPTWNATVLQGEVATAVAQLKEQPGQDLLIYGSGDLVDALTREGLIDRYRLMVFPVVAGEGKRLFNEVDQTTLRLVDTSITSTGVIVADYEPVAEDAGAEDAAATPTA